MGGLLRKDKTGRMKRGKVKDEKTEEFEAVDRQGKKKI
jgi:hypothetical protein